MTTAYWCVFAVILLPYLLVAVARLPDLTLEKNLIPRIASESLTGVRRRAYWAHLNALEVIAPFASVVIIAHQLGLNQNALDRLALLFVALRIAHAVAYMADRGVLRTLMFVGAYGSMVTIFLKAAV